ncbi:MAG: hypothetical protein P1U56_13970 [Saprospiraceae bacterium]|nr:hypothetical protein [Saprospiraceae bacterium]
MPITYILHSPSLGRYYVGATTLTVEERILELEENLNEIDTMKASLAELKTLLLKQENNE